MQEKWHTKAYDLQEHSGKRAKFADLVEFVSHQSRILSHPLFGSLNPTQARKAGLLQPCKLIPKDRRHKSGLGGFATTVTPVTHSSPVIEYADKMQKKLIQECLHCKGAHNLVSCPQLKKKTHEQKLEFLRNKGVCFGCFEVGHMSKGCQKRLTCQVCSMKHPRILHINKKEVIAPKDENSKDTSVTNALININQTDVWSNTGAGDSECKLAIVPVKVKMKKSNMVILSYVFMDPGSTGTFCTESLLRQLRTTSNRTNILLRTMSKEHVVKTQSVTGVEIYGLESNEYLELPEVYSHPMIPVSAENIPSQEDVKQWLYLHEVKIPKITAEIGLLIGNNVPKALEPWKAINSQKDGPYAVKTILGWTIT